MDDMAGRPPKDPTGELIPTSFKLRERTKKAAKAKALEHGMTFTDYIEALIAADIPDLHDVPGIQEVLEGQLPRSA